MEITSAFGCQQGRIYIWASMGCSPGAPRLEPPPKKKKTTQKNNNKKQKNNNKQTTTTKNNKNKNKKQTKNTKNTKNTKKNTIKKHNNYTHLRRTYVIKGPKLYILLVQRHLKASGLGCQLYE